MFFELVRSEGRIEYSRSNQPTPGRAPPAPTKGPTPPWGGRGPGRRISSGRACLNRKSVVGRVPKLLGGFQFRLAPIQPENFNDHQSNLPVPTRECWSTLFKNGGGFTSRADWAVKSDGMVLMGVSKKKRIVRSLPRSYRKTLGTQSHPPKTLVGLRWFR